MDDPADFYTGLVADLYEPLASEHARADQYVPFLERTGSPVLELACGTGLPLLDLVARGYDVDGLDASADMLRHCRAAAAARGLTVNVYQARMQSFALPRRYRGIFLAGASFTLLTSDADALATLRCMYDHLLPGGSVLIPLEIVDTDAVRASLGRFAEFAGHGGERLRCAVLDVSASPDGRDVERRLRYERERPGAPVEAVERLWQTRAWSQHDFTGLLTSAGFERPRMLAPGGGRAAPDARVFVAVAVRGGARDAFPGGMVMSSRDENRER